MKFLTRKGEPGVDSARELSIAQGGFPLIMIARWEPAVAERPNKTLASESASTQYQMRCLQQNLPTWHSRSSARNGIRHLHRVGVADRQDRRPQPASRLSYDSVGGGSEVMHLDNEKIPEVYGHMTKINKRRLAA